MNFGLGGLGGGIKMLNFFIYHFIFTNFRDNYYFTDLDACKEVVSILYTFCFPYNLHL